jgi:hypothetical protein
MRSSLEELQILWTLSTICPAKNIFGVLDSQIGYDFSKADSEAEQSPEPEVAVNSASSCLSGYSDTWQGIFGRDQEINNIKPIARTSIHSRCLTAYLHESHHVWFLISEHFISLMLLTLKQNLRRSQPRSSTPDVLQAFETVPDVPVDIQKADFVVLNSSRNKTKSRWKFRIFEHSQTTSLPNSVSIPRLTATQTEISQSLADGSSPAATSTSQKPSSLNCDQTREITAGPPSVPSLVIQLPSRNSAGLELVESDLTPKPNVLPVDRGDRDIIIANSFLQPALSTQSVDTSGPHTPAQIVETRNSIDDGNTFHPIIGAPTVADPVNSAAPTEASESIPVVTLPERQSLQVEPETGLLPLRRIRSNCYIAIDTPVAPQFRLQNNVEVNKRLRSFLQSLELKNKNVVLDCAAASTNLSRQNLKPTILFLCLEVEQQRRISSALQQREGKTPEVVPSSHYRYAVLVQETRLCSSPVDQAFSFEGEISGQLVEAILRDDKSLCGVLCRMSGVIVRPQCTLGGVVIIQGLVYALTTSHAFLGLSSVSSTRGSIGGELLFPRLDWPMQCD